MENFEIYRGGARKVRRGWTRGWRDGSRVCLLQSIIDESHYDHVLDRLPASIVDEIDASLQQYPSYRLMRRIVLATGGGKVECITAWNDFMGTQQRVAKALDKLADESELQFLRAEQLRLQLKVQNYLRRIEELADRVSSLQDRVDELEAENGTLRRLTNSAALAADRRELSRLDRELDAYADALGEARDRLASERFARLR